jgi:hypothetical protein
VPDALRTAPGIAAKILFQKKVYLLEKPLAGWHVLQKKMILALKWNEPGTRNAGSQ